MQQAWKIAVAILIAAGLGYGWPTPFAALQTWIVPLLTLIMFAMGLSLRWQDFRRAWQLRRVLFLGVALQFTVMPLAAVGLAWALQLPQSWWIGMVLVGTAAGGTASNVMTYLARGNLALSISMTLVSTLLAILLMPALTWLTLQSEISVPVAAIFHTLATVMLVPLLLGMGLRALWPAMVLSVSPVLPWLAIAAIALIVAIVMALNANNLQSLVWTLALAVMLHNLLGLAAGYGVSRLLGYDTVVARTVAIEVAMQNSGLSVAIAVKYFGAASALPGALFSVWHNVSGVLFAAYWQSRSIRDKKE
ncbi:MAG: bile acid:sodium symporter family protein [Thiotrichales bacterium]|nr:bile acid:sodium symporter family protein [Thiotrichales bacterium]